MVKSFYDGVKDIFNSLTNRRSVLNRNIVVSNQVSNEQLNAVYKTGIGSKIIRLKVAYALNDTIKFNSVHDENFYNARLRKSVKRASKFMMGFGRGVIILHEKGSSLDKPYSLTDPKKLIIKVFDGTQVQPADIDRDLESERYLKPIEYFIKGKRVHHSRVIDFTYYEPIDEDKPNYNYGGISEFELIYNQIINDAVVERAAPTIVEKNSTVFYKVKDFYQRVQDKKDKSLIEYFTRVEDLRNIYGAGIIDANDEVINIDQALTNLSESDQITLRRLAMVTGIPLAWLIGENVQGLNSSGDTEHQALQDTIENLQFDYILDPLNELMFKLGLGFIEFKDNQGGTPEDRIDYESKAIENAVKLDSLGENYKKYLIDRDIIIKDDLSKFFPDEEE